MANLQLSPTSGHFSATPNGPFNRAWFENKFTSPPTIMRKSIVFEKDDLMKLTKPTANGGQGCKEFVFSKQKHENEVTLVVAGVDSAFELQVDQGHQLFLGNDFEFPRPNGNVTRDDFVMNMVERTQGSVKFKFSMLSSTSQILDNLIDRLRSFSDEPNANLFLTSKFTVNDLNPLLSSQICTQIAFVPIYIQCDEVATVNRNGTNVTEKSTSLMETLAVFGLNESGDIIVGPPYIVSTDSWPRPYPPYNRV
jgi:hypothetical protein